MSEHPLPPLFWNKIDVERWTYGENGYRQELTIDVNEYSEDPVCLAVESRRGDDAVFFLSLDKARELAAQLIALADAAERAGRFVYPEGEKASA